MLLVGVAYGVTLVMVSRKATLGLPVKQGQLYSDFIRWKEAVHKELTCIHLSIVEPHYNDNFRDWRVFGIPKSSVY